MKTIKDYETMAKLNLNDPERQWILDRMEMLTDSFRELDAIDTSTVEPLVTVLDVRNILRDDISKKFISRDELLLNAPEQYNGYFQVPRTLD